MIAAMILAGFQPYLKILNVPLVTRQRCHYCSHQKDPREMFHMSGDVWKCQLCEEWHNKALLMLAGTPPSGCQTCDRTYAELERMHGANVRFVAVPKDGLYQVLCGPCADNYIPQRRDLIKGTRYAHELRAF